MLRKLILLFSFICITLLGFGQNQSLKGIDFWLGFQENVFTPAITISISSSRVTSGNVSILAAGFSQNFTVATNGLTQISIPISIGMATLSDVSESKAIHIVANDTIIVVASNTSNHSTDITSVLPVPLLGTEYYIFSYQGINGGAIAEFLLVPTDTNTVVQITPTDSTNGGHLPNVSYSVILQKGDVYQIKSSFGDLSGSHIISSKPLAVFGGHQCAIIPSGAWCDHLYEQMYPITSWGKDFITMPLKTRLNGDTYKIIASMDSTVITINAGNPYYLNEGQVFTFNLVSASKILTNKPIGLAHYSNSQTYDGVLNSDPFMTLLSPQANLIFKSIFTTFSGNVITDDYLNVLIKTSCINTLKLNGNFVNPNFFISIPFTNYSYAQLNIYPGTHKIESDSGFIAYAYGYGNAEGYGYTLADIKLSTLTGWDEVGSPSFHLFTVSPNPLINSSILKANPDNIGNLDFKLMDATGKILLIDVLVVGTLYLLEKKNLSKGMYFIQVRDSKNRTETQKLIVE